MGIKLLMFMYIRGCHCQRDCIYTNISSNKIAYKLSPLEDMYDQYPTMSTTILVVCLVLIQCRLAISQRSSE